MTSIHYLAGATVDSRQQMLDKKLSQWKGGPVLHLVSTRGRVIELESDHRFWPRRRQDTLTGIIYKIFEEDIRHRQFRNYRQMDDDILSLIVKKAVEKRASQPDGLIYFNRLFTEHDRDLDFPGIFKEVTGFFSQLIHNNYQDRFVNDLAGKIIRAEEKGNLSGEELFALESDLAWLFGDYEEIKKDLRVYDADDVFLSVRDFLSRAYVPYPVKDVDVIVFDGFIHISRLEEDILHYLFNRVKEVWWLLDYDGGTEDPAKDFKESCKRSSEKIGDMEAYRIFATMTSFMNRLETEGFNTITERCRDAHFLNPLAECLYLDGRLREKTNNSLKIRFFPNRIDEIRAIAREIKRIIHEDKLDISRDLGKIRIIFPELREYSSQISEIFKEYGIPFSLTSGIPLLSHPLSNLFLLMLKLPLNRFKREDVFRFFSSELIQKRDLPSPCHDNSYVLRLLEGNLLAGDDLGSLETMINGHSSGLAPEEIIDMDFIDSVARRCGINNFDDNIVGQGRVISTVRDFYDGRLAKVMESVERDDLKRGYYRFILQYDLLVNMLVPFMDLINTGDPHGMENTFSILLKDLGFPGNILDAHDLTDSFTRTDEMKMIKRDIKAYSLLKDLISASASELMIENRLFRSGSGREQLVKFYGIFLNRLENSYLLDEQDPDVIRISQWLEIRGRSFDYIFAGGLTDKSFPLKEETSFMVPEPFKRRFRIPDNIDISRYLLSHLLRNYRKGLYLSCPEYVDEKKVHPSNIFTDIESMISKEGPLSDQEDETLEMTFKWDDCPFLSSPREMLDASIKKVNHDNREPQSLFPLKDVIVPRDSLFEGIIRGLRVMGSRWALNGLFEYDGLTARAESFNEFLKKKKDIFSSSQLETLANCPMRYLFERIYGLKVMEIAGPEVSPADMGEHLHGVLGAFFRRLQAMGKNVSEIGVRQAFTEARETAEEYFRSLPFLDRIEFFEHQKNEFLAGLDHNIDDSIAVSKAREGPFALLLRFEEKGFKDRIPEGIEYEFGFNGLSSPSLGNVRLRGFIDRFDRDINDKGCFYIYDYKTGALPSSTLIKKGLSFQLPVYIKALKTCLKAKKITAAIYSLKKDNLLKDDPLGHYIYDNAGDAEGLDITGIVVMDHYVDELMLLLEQGRFHHSADMVHCEYCDFRYACHMDERRMDCLVTSEGDHGIYSGKRNLETWRLADDFRNEWKKVLESMEKAFHLKTASGRKKHYEIVMAFRDKLLKGRDSLPFDRGDTDELIAGIEDFKERFFGHAG